MYVELSGRGCGMLLSRISDSFSTNKVVEVRGVGSLTVMAEDLNSGGGR